jgi:hypothetical protein
MPASLVAVGVLVVLFVPGYLFQAGVKEHSSVLAAERDLYALAQAVAISSGFIIVVFILIWPVQALSIWPAESLHTALLHNPAKAGEEGFTLAQLAFLLFLLVFSVPIGRLFGRRIGSIHKDSEDDPEAPDEVEEEPDGEENDGALLRWLKTCLRFFFARSPLEERLDEVADAGLQKPTYVRLVGQDREDVIGLVDADAAIATKCNRGQGLALTIRWARDAEGCWQQLGGAHIGKTGIVEIFTWNPGEGARPGWLTGVPL